jgi:hypothetical protein
MDACLALICILKGKYRSGLFGLFLPPVGAIGAVRLARPNSIWARHRYRGKRLERATRRAAAFDRRWKPLQAGWLDFIGGRPSLPNPASSPAPPAAGAPGGGAPGGGAAPDEPAAARAAGLTGPTGAPRRRRSAAGSFASRPRTGSDFPRAGNRSGGGSGRCALAGGG